MSEFALLWSKTFKSFKPFNPPPVSSPARRLCRNAKITRMSF
jgi:hypothetical protein